VGYERSRSDKGKRRGERVRHPGGETGFTRLFISLGRKDKVVPQTIIGLVNEVTRSRDIKIGRIDIMDNFSFIDVDSQAAEVVVNAFNTPKLNRQNVRVEAAGPRTESAESGYKKKDKDRKKDKPRKKKRF
jgi:ATP-dependent RNA helicase DeaD